MVQPSKSIGCCSSTALSDAVGMPDFRCQNGRFFAYHLEVPKRGPPPTLPRGREIFGQISGSNYFLTFFHHDHLILGFSSGFISWDGWHWGYPSIPLSIVSVENTRHICLKQRNALHYCKLHEIHHPENIEKKSLTVFDYILCGILWVIRGEVVRTDCFFFRETYNIDAIIAVISKLNLHPTKKDTKQDFFWVTCVNPPKKTNLWLFFICRHINSLLFPYFSPTKEHRLVEQKYQTFLYTSRCGQTNVNMTRGVWWVTDVLMFQLLIGW